MAFTFTAKVASRGFHVYKNTTWNDVKEGDKVVVEIERNPKSKEIDPYCCAIKTSLSSGELKTVGHIPREVSRHFYFFIKEEGGRVDGSVQSTRYRPSSIPNGGLEIPLMLTFRSPRFITHQKMKDFMTKLYCYDYEPAATEQEDSDDEESIHIDLDIEVAESSRKREEREEEDSDNGEVIGPKKKIQ